MEHSKYNYGFKTVAVLLQMVFIMVVIVIFSLLSNLFERSMLSFRDLGNSSFFHSSYYMETVAEEIRDLVIYLQLKDTSEQTELQTEKYKKMKLKFDNGDSNFYYWFTLDGDVSTNMPGGLSKEEALSHAKELGSYFYYDDTAISFQGNFLFLDRISNIEILRLFSQGAAGGSFITAVDENNVIVVKDLSEGDNPREIERMAGTIETFLKKEGQRDVHIAYGTVVKEIKEVSRSYKEAKMAMDVGKIFFDDRDIIAYSELGIGRLIYQLPIPLCKMFIREIFGGRSPDEFDEETLSTINKFFENSLNVSETSRQLFIHRNTLVYRLDKLQKSTGLDLRVFEDAITFRIALMVVNYMEGFEY